MQGSRRAPYDIVIRIDAVSEAKCQRIIERCTRKVANLEQLLSGQFPDEMKELFIGQDGLFPTPKEISFSCSCPDWAYMCKHVAAALYGIGVRFDEDPLLFFRLRGIDFARFVDASLATKVDHMLENAAAAAASSRRVLRSEDDITRLFGVL